MYKKYVADVSNALAQLPFARVEEATQEISRARERGNWVYLFGNGGSAANASHWANGLQSVGVKVHVLDCVPIVTAIANDFSYDLIFRKQLETVLLPSDIAVGFSCSGNSESVLKAIRFARGRIETIGLTAFDGGKLKKLVDIPIHVPVDSYEIGEDIHSIVGHMITLRLKE